MKRTIFAFVCFAGLLLAADKDFNGRWDISVPENDRRRAWWLEVMNAESGKPVGSFISAYAGDLNKFDESKIENGELHLDFSLQGQSADGHASQGEILDGKLVGTREVEGTPGKLSFTGVRAPKFKSLDARS